jgi:hypothetical protein
MSKVWMLERPEGSSNFFKVDKPENYFRIKIPLQLDETKKLTTPLNNSSGSGVLNWNF